MRSASIKRTYATLFLLLSLFVVLVQCTKSDTVEGYAEDLMVLEHLKYTAASTGPISLSDPAAVSSIKIDFSDWETTQRSNTFLRVLGLPENEELRARIC